MKKMNKKKKIQKEIYKILYELSQATPSKCDLIEQKLREIQQKYPEFEEEIIKSIEQGEKFPRRVAVRAGGISPVKVDELLEKDPKENIEWLLNFKEEEFMGPDRYGLLETIREAVEKDFEWSWKLVEALYDLKNWISDIWSKIFEGWIIGINSPEQWYKALKFLKENPELYKNHHWSISFLLSEAIEKNNAFTTEVIPPAIALANQLWDVLENRDTRDNRQFINKETDWLSKAVSHSGGSIALFWLKALSKMISEKKSNSKSLPQEFVQFYQKISKNESLATQMARVIFASQLHFFYNINPEWTRQNLIPFFNWSKDKTIAEQVWHGFLFWGILNEDLITEMMPYYRATFRFSKEFPQQYREKFCNHLAVIAIFYPKNPLEDSWLKEFLEIAELEDRLEFTRQLGWQLEELNERVLTDLWNRWLSQYLTKRIRGRPVRLEAKEAGVIAGWAPEMGPVFEEFVDKICEFTSLELEEHHWIYRRIKEKEIDKKYPEQIIKLLSKIVPFEKHSWYCDDLIEILNNLTKSNIAKSKTNLTKLKEICGELIKLGCQIPDEIINFFQT